MKTFKDNRGRSYEIHINIAQLKRVKGTLDADLLDLDKTFLRLIADPIFFVDVLYVLCKSQADAYGASDEDFGEAMAGDTIGLAKVALVEELRNFFPSREERDAAGMAIQKGIELRNTMRKAGLKILEMTDMEKVVETLLEKAFVQEEETLIYAPKIADRNEVAGRRMRWSGTLLGESSTNLPESSDVIPANSLSGN